MVGIMRKWGLFLFLLLLAAALFSIYSHNTVDRFFDTQDETINFFFINNYIETGKFSYIEEVNSVAENAVRVQETEIAGNNTVFARTFPGVVVFYAPTIALIKDVARYITPVFALVAILAMFLLVRELFSERAAILAALLTAVFPPFAYWTNFPLMINVTASSLTLLGIFCCVKAVKASATRYYVLSAFFAGVVTTMRMDYAALFAIGAGLSLLYLAFLKQWKGVVAGLLSWGLTFGIAVLPLLLINRSLRGEDLQTGYQYNVPFFYHSPSLKYLFHNLFTVANAITYAYILLAVLGGVLLCRGVMRRKPSPSADDVLHRSLVAYYLIFLASGTVLYVAYHLLWTLPPARPIFLQESFNRYLLPLYLFFLPLCGYLMGRLTSINMTRIVSPIIIGAIIVFSLIYTVDNLQMIWKARVSYRDAGNYVLRNTEDNAVIMTGNYDKLFFPERKVVSINILVYEERKQIEDISAGIAYNILNVKQLPVYFFNTFAKEQFDMNEFKSSLEKRKLQINTLGSVFYSITPAPG